MNLTYWVAEIQTDSPSYNIRRKSKKEVTQELQRQGLTPIMTAGKTEWYHSEFDENPQYGQIHKVTITFKNSFDLLCQCLGEGGISESI